jgi:hypothetical protein
VSLETLHDAWDSKQMMVAALLALGLTGTNPTIGPAMATIS